MRKITWVLVLGAFSKDINSSSMSWEGLELLTSGTTVSCSLEKSLLLKDTPLVGVKHVFCS